MTNLLVTKPPELKLSRLVGLDHPSAQVARLTFGELTGVKVLFVNMPLRESAKPNTPPQGPGLMAARLRQYGAEPTILDLNAYRLQDADAMARGLPNGRHLKLQEAEQLLEAHLAKHGDQDIIAFSGMITTLRWQENFARICRKLQPGAFLVSGGGLATEIREGLFGWIPELDAVAHSEGDDVILLMAKEINHLKERGGRKNLSLLSNSPYYLGEIGGQHRLMYAGDRPVNLDVLPFAAWDLLHEDVHGNPLLEWYIKTPVWGTAANNSSATSFTMKRSLTTVSSRGCPYACEFCFRGGQGERNYGMRSPANLRAEAEWLIRTYGIDFLGFPDDNFGVNIPRMKALPETFEGLGIRWGTHTRLDEADDRARYMAKAGCIYIGFGAESASARVLESMGKGGFILRPRGSRENQLTQVGDHRFPVTMMNGIKMCKETGIHANCTWIMGWPEEGLREIKTSVAFIMWQIGEMTRGKTPGTPDYDLAVASVNKRMFTATAYPGTQMCRHPKVQELLGEHFGISFAQKAGCKLEPVVDEYLRKYVLELDDATKVLHGTDGKPLNYGELSEEQFLEARGYIDSDKTERILDMTG